ncbi:MAG TPA: hypothetical protein VK110_01745 [Salinisphaeraceae bacterium]|nr:hypothetical protein [Salinisphaeraceae bacterium]
MLYLIGIVVVILLAIGIAHAVRRQIAISREQLKHVDRSKLKDLDQDAWAEEERRNDE